MLRGMHIYDDCTDQSTGGSKRRRRRKAPGAGRQAVRDRRRRILLVSSALAPAASQCAMAIIMGIEGRWPLVMMFIPGLFGCLASAALLIDGMRNEKEREHIAAQVASGQASPCPRPAPQPGDLPQPPTLEALLATDGGQPSWQSFVRGWLAGPRLAVPVGYGDGGGAILLDIGRQGPHALVAGTTGSGKSVLLQAWCLALASANPPSRLNFVFLDFKGGATFRHLATLPHCVGNVCDLDLAHATRALLALERELRRREQLVAQAGCASLDDLDAPPPRLVIVADEFHAVRAMLPDYLDRVTRVTSLGRSLGMHLIACTQNPLGQVSAEMKANISLHVCLRVNDAMQSSEMLGSGAAQAISPRCPGAAYCYDGESLQPLRCSEVGDIRRLTRHITLACRFFSGTRPAALFFPPLPRTVDAIPTPLAAGAAADDSGAPVIPIGIEDDGTAWHAAGLRLHHGNIAIIGRSGGGRSTLLSLLARQARGRGMRVVDLCDGPRHGPPPLPLAGENLRGERQLWVADDADDLLDPLNGDPTAVRLRAAMRDDSTVVAIVAGTTRHIGIQDAATRVIFPTGDRAHDMMLGIPPAVLSKFERDDYATCGRCVVLDGATAGIVQCLRYQYPQNDDNSLG